MLSGSRLRRQQKHTVQDGDEAPVTWQLSPLRHTGHSCSSSSASKQQYSAALQELGDGAQERACGREKIGAVRMFIEGQGELLGMLEGVACSCGCCLDTD